ncbi:unnamed protein product [Effrenium voratum]|uniref:PAS domain-containing protein n=1 Tax=Effrenium voratum TaxID=2562239 RepID=A0AA36IZ35_9DINO|nr:unnamed protein product [Effrenium voratum]CAJ1424815.1 unnamed protein product [Effrenium voratum]
MELEELDQSHIVYLAASLSLEVAFLCRFAYVAYKHRKSIAEWLQSCRLSKIMSSHRSRRDRRIQEGISQHRLSVAQSMLNYLIIVMLTAITTVQLNLVLTRTLWLSLGQLWLVLALTVLLLLCKTFPLLQTWSLDVFYLVFCGLCVGYVSKELAPPSTYVRFSLVSLAFLRLPAVVFATRTPVVVAGNLATLLHAFWRVSNEDFTAPHDTALTGNFALRIELMCFTHLMGFFMIMGRIMRQKVELELERGNVATQLSAASSLLSLTCDAVIELDSDLRLTSHSAQLASVMLNSGTTSLEGQSFLSFMPPEEAHRAQELLTGDAASHATVTANVFHTRLWDCFSSKICTEVFQVRYNKMDGETYNLLGLREFTDVKSLAGKRASFSLEESESDQATGLPAPSGRKFGSIESVYSFQSVASSSVEESEPEPKMFLEVDAEGMMVHAASAPLTSLAGMALSEVFPSPHTALLFAQLKHSDASSRVLNFKDLPIACAMPCTRISGSMRATKNRYGHVHLLMAFAFAESDRIFSKTAL